MIWITHGPSVRLVAWGLFLAIHRLILSGHSKHQLFYQAARALIFMLRLSSFPHHAWHL